MVSVTWVLRHWEGLHILFADLPPDLSCSGLGRQEAALRVSGKAGPMQTLLRRVGLLFLDCWDAYVRSRMVYPGDYGIYVGCWGQPYILLD